MNWVVFAPEADATFGPPSGGYLYNHELAEALRRLGESFLPLPQQGRGVKVFPRAELVSSSPQPSPSREERETVVLVDALGATDAVDVPGKKVALVHMAPPFSDGAQRFFSSVDLVVGVSASVLDDVRERFVLSAPCRVVEAGADHFEPVTNVPNRRLLGIGHVLPHKGVLEALEACADVPGEWSLDWLGGTDVDPEYTQQVMERRRELGLETRVRFPGRVRREAVTKALSRCAALVSTSFREAWGLAAVEALVCGVPLVTWTTGGVFERARAAGAGCFVGRGDVDRLRVGLTDALSGRAEWKAAALAVAKTFHTWDDCAQEMIAACCAP